MEISFNRRKTWHTIPVLFFLLLGINSGAFSQDGEKLFKQNCATCHKITDKRSTGPGLKGFWDRIPGDDDEGKKKWLVNWVQNSSSIVNAKSDSYINTLFDEYGTAMTSQAHLKEDQIMSIVDYIKNPPVDVTAQTEISEADPWAPKPESSNLPDIIWLIGIGVALFAVIKILSAVNNSLDNAIKEKDGKRTDVSGNLVFEAKAWVGRHKVLTTLFVLSVVMWGCKEGWYALKDIGVYQEYEPLQPIKFSHKVHAGKNGINCVYCHHSAEKGKNAGIPSVNVCMNCHKGVQEGTITGSAEINKIYEAAGWNPDKMAYDKPGKPIKWVRIHNLPDFAYFNHSQHVIVGKQKCQTCHGPVEEMHILKQHSPLTMGWCIDCHRKTDVQMEGNEYYETMHAQLKEQFKEEGKEVFKVEQIGGLECAKCHY